MKKPFRPKTQFDGAFLAYGVTKKLGKVTIGGVKTVGGDLFDAAGDIYHGSLSTLSRNGITKPQKINDSLVAGVHNIYDAIDDKLIDLTSDKVNLDGTTSLKISEVFLLVNADLKDMKLGKDDKLDVIGEYNDDIYELSNKYVSNNYSCQW